MKSYDKKIIYGAIISKSGITCESCGSDLMPEEAVRLLSHSDTAHETTDTFACRECGHLITRRLTKKWAHYHNERKKIGGRA